MDDKKRLVYFLIIIVLIAGLSFTLYNAYEKGWIGNKKQNTPAPTPMPTEVVNTVSYSGVYSIEDSTIKIYQVDNEKAKFFISTNSNDFVEGSAKIGTDSMVGEIFNQYTFVIKDNGIEFSTTDENLSQGFYARTGDYTKEDYYRDEYGDINLINSIYNGKYELDGATIYIYQSGEKETHVIAQKSISSLDIPFEIQSEQTLHGTIFDDEYTITLNGGELTFTTVKGDKTFDGTYKRTAVLTIDDIISYFSI